MLVSGHHYVVGLPRYITFLMTSIHPTGNFWHLLCSLLLAYASTSRIQSVHPIQLNTNRLLSQLFRAEAHTRQIFGTALVTILGTSTE